MYPSRLVQCHFELSHVHVHCMSINAYHLTYTYFTVFLDLIVECVDISKILSYTVCMRPCLLHVPYIYVHVATEFYFGD